MADQAYKLREMVGAHAEVVEKNNLNARVITVTSGKGGVGKTNFTVNLAIMLSRQGKRVVIIDADFGLANIEVLFGVMPRYSLQDVITGEKTISEILTPGPENIYFISGGSGVLELIRINPLEIKRFIDGLIELDSFADIILVDTGAGISDTVLNFIKAANETIIITTPEPTSITDAYALIKTLKSECPNELIPEIKLVINRVDDFEEGFDVYNKIKNVSSRFLDLHISNLGCIPYDVKLVKAVKKQAPVVTLEPMSNFATAIVTICDKLLGTETKVEQKGIANFMKRLVKLFNN